MLKFHGMWAIVPSPLTPDEELDEPALRRVLRYVMEGGVHGLWMLGSGGEQPLLSPRVSRRVLEVAVEEARGNFPVMAGIGACSVREALEKMRLAREAGVDGVQSVEPYYYKLSASEIVDYFLTLADASELPLVIYHWPERWPAGSVSPAKLPQTLGRLAEHPMIIGMKDVTRDPRDLQRIVFALASEDFGVMSAAGRLLFLTLALGGQGGAMVEGTIAPRLCVELYDAFVGGDILRAREIQRRLAPLGDVLTTGGAKCAMNLLGLCDERPARPMANVGEESRASLASVMKDLRLI